MLSVLSWIDQYLLGAAVPLLLMGTGIFYLFRLGWFPLLHPVKLWRALTERRGTGGVSPFRALTLALAGTLGVGNIVGVSAAIALGGFGSIFWMWVSALCAMLLSHGRNTWRRRGASPPRQSGGGGGLCPALPRQRGEYGERDPGGRHRGGV